MAKISKWRSSKSSTVEVDLFEYKEEFLENISNKELVEELARRTEINEVVEKRISYDIDYDIDLYDYINESLDIADDDDLIDELESRGYITHQKSDITNYKGSSKELAEFLGLKWWSTKEQILKEINNLL